MMKLLMYRLLRSKVQKVPNHPKSKRKGLLFSRLQIGISTFDLAQ